MFYMYASGFTNEYIMLHDIRNHWFSNDMSLPGCYVNDIANANLISRDDFLSNDNLRFLSTSANTVIIKEQRFSKLLSHFNKSPRSLINKVNKTLGLPALEKLDATNVEREKQVELTDNVRMLQEILKQCPKATINKPKLMTPKQFLRNRVGEAKEITDYDIMCKEFDRTKLVYDMLVLAHNDTSALTEEWYTPETLTQYRALCLMQSYTKSFKSCQHLPLHEFSKETIESYLDHGELNSSLDLRLVNSYWAENQDIDFRTERCKRYFQLTDEGYVNKRFHVYTYGYRLYLSNFYNTSPRYSLTIDGITIASCNIRELETDKICGYINNDNASYLSIAEL